MTSVEEQIQTIKDNVDLVYQAGYNKGLSNGGGGGSQDNYRKTFWDIYQMNGTRTNYAYAFYSADADSIVWDDTNYDPQYPLAPTVANYMYASSGITEIGVLDLSNCSGCTALFSTSRLLNKIEKLIVSDTFSTVQNMFRNCSELEDVTFEGVLSITGVSLQWSTKLSKSSITSLINVLSSTVTGKTITLSIAAVNAAFGIDVNDSSTFPEGSEWHNLRNSKSNWTISFA